MCWQIRSTKEDSEIYRYNMAEVGGSLIMYHLRRNDLGE